LDGKGRADKEAQEGAVGKNAEPGPKKGKYPTGIRKETLKQQARATSEEKFYELRKDGCGRGR